MAKATKDGLEVDDAAPRRKLPPGITQLPSGNYHALARVKGVPTFSQTFPTIKEAREWREAKLTEIRAGKIGQWPRKTLLDALDRYSDDVSPGKDGAKWETLRLAAFKRHFAALPKHGDITGMLLYEVDTPHIADLRDMRLKQVSEGTVLREFNLLRNVFSIARKEWKWTDKRPFEGLRMPQDNPARTRRSGWSEVRRLVRHLGYKTGEPPVTKQGQVAYSYLLAMHTAMRPIELLRLHQEDVDLKKRVLRVKRKTYHLTKAIREVPFSPQAARLFRVLIDGLGGPLFTVTSASRDALFRKARAQVQVDKTLQFRDSRADAATRLVKKKKVDLLELARILDHKDLEQLRRTYFRKTAEEIARDL